MMLKYFLLTSLVGLAASGFCQTKIAKAGNSIRRPLSVSIGITGDTLDVKTVTQAGTVLMGGSTDVDEAIRWMIKRSGGGDFVVIRASGSTGYNEYIKQLGDVNSVETLLIDSRAKANLAETRNKIRNAEALFIAGGDQSNYVRFWADTELSKAIQYLVNQKKIPIGGTSAGCAVLTGYIFDANHGSTLSDQALANPYDSSVSISKSFISVPVLQNVIADQHYSQRKRQGRHVVFMARIVRDFHEPYLIGIGVDEKTAIAVEENGDTKVFGLGSAWFLKSHQAPEQCEPGEKLTWNLGAKALSVYKVQGSQSGTTGINLLQSVPAKADQYWYVKDGVLKVN